MTSVDLGLHSTFESQLLNLIEVATQMARGREEARQRMDQLEVKLKVAQTELERTKRERAEERDANQAKERKHSDETSNLLIQLEKAKSQMEELTAKCGSYKSQNETLEASLAQLQSTGTGGVGQPRTNRLSQLVNKEVIEQVTSIQDHVKQLEQRISTMAANASLAESKASEMSKLLVASDDTVRRSKVQLEQVRAANCEAGLRIRTDAATISSLTLDIENLQEQVNRFKEETASLGQQRRNLESELERIKFSIASSLLATLEKESMYLSNNVALTALARPEEPGAELPSLVASSGATKHVLALQDVSNPV
jgi:DNA repair exonuclease SbcCD ATPase subunit